MISINGTVNELDDTVNALDDTVNALDDTVNELDDTVKDTIKQRWGQIVQLVERKSGIRMPELVDTIKVSETTIKGDMQKLKKLVEFRGSQKTGGYFLTEYMQTKLDTKDSL